MTGFRNRTIAGVSGRPALRIDHRDLANLAAFIGDQQARERFGRGTARAHQVEPKGSITRIDKGLRRDGAHLGLRMNDHRADREPMRLDGSAQLAGRGITRDDHSRLTTCGCRRGIGQKRSHDISELLPGVSNACVYRHSHVQLEHQPIRSRRQSDAGAD